MPENQGVAELPVAVIGGGITGLTAAFELVANSRRVRLFEKSQTLGGKIAETTIDGTVIPTGPDAFLARRPEVSELATELGLGGSLVSPEARAARIYRNGELHPLPPNVLGVPATSDLAATGLISAAGAAFAERSEGDEIHPLVEDESVGALVRRQLGDEVLEFLVDPLLGGINAGDSDRLSVMAGVPQLDLLRKRHPRLIDGAAETINEARKTTDSADPPPVFHSIDGGLGRLIDRLVEELNSSGLVEFATGTTPRVEPCSTGWQVDGQRVAGVISTIPAPATSRLIHHFATEASAILDSIEYSSVALSIVVLAPETIDVDPSISGVLVPRSLGHHVTAVSFASHKWPNLAVGGRQVLRVSVGRRTNDTWTSLEDEQLVDAIERDLSEIFGVEVHSTSAEVHRWMHALPQYDVGHLDRIARLDETISGLDGLVLTGAWRDGLGLPACVAAGRAAARSIQS